MQTQLLGLGGVVDAGLLQRLKEKEQPADYQALQARVIQLEGQVCPDVMDKKDGRCDRGSIVTVFFYFIFCSELL